MTTSRDVRLAGVRCRLSLDAATLAVLGERYAAYIVDGEGEPPNQSEEPSRFARNEGPELRAELRADPSLFIDIPGEDYPAAEVRLDAEGRYRIRRHDLDATLDLDAGPEPIRGALGQGTARLTATAQPTLAVEAALRIAIALVLPRRGGLLLHSSGVVEGGRGYVFSGPSGMGKTTTVRLLAPRPPLGDDLVALLPRAGGEPGFCAVATPFAGEYGVVSPREAPLERLFFLEQAPSHESIPLSPADARTQILRNTLAYVRDPATAGLLQDVAARIAAEVPCARLRFARDPGIARFLAPRGA